MFYIEHTDKFPHPTLTKLGPERESIVTLQILQRDINANSMGVPSDSEGGQHGYLAHIISTAKFDYLTGTQPWEAATPFTTDTL